MYLTHSNAVRKNSTKDNVLILDGSKGNSPKLMTPNSAAIVSIYIYHLSGSPEYVMCYHT